MSPPIFRLTPLVASLQLFSAGAMAETLSYYANPDTSQASLSFNTNCAVNEINFDREHSKLVCPGGTLPPAPTCSSFGAVNLSLSPNATPARVVDGRRGDTLLFTGSCAIGAGSTSEAPLSYRLLPGDGESPVATTQIDAHFAIKVPSDAPIGSLVPYRLRAEQAGAVSGTVNAAYKVIDTVIEAPTSCVLSTQPFAWTTGSNSPTISVGCAGLTGNQAYRWFVNSTLQSGQTGASLPAGALNSLAASSVSYTISARTCNDPSQADSGGSTCSTASANAVVNAANVTPTPSNCSIQLSHGLPVASGTNVSFSLSGCVNTTGTGFTTSYAWTKDGFAFGTNSASASSVFNNGGTAESSSAVAVQVCNTPTAGGAAVCHSPAPSTTVRVSPGVASPGIDCNGVLAGITKTTVVDVDLATISPYESDWILHPTNTAIVLRFRTRNQDGNGAFGRAWSSNQAGAAKHVVLSTTACAKWNDSGVIGYAAGGYSSEVTFQVGSGTSGRILTPNTQYYLTVTNRSWGGSDYNVNSCPAPNTCDAKVGVTSP